MGLESDQEDRDLLDQWNAGNRVAGNRLVRKHHTKLAAFFTNAVSDDERQDLTQKTFAKLVEAKARFRGDSSVRTFLFKIAHHVLIDHLRSRYRSAQTFDPLTHSVEDIEGATPSMAVAELQRNRKVLTCLRALPVETKQLLELYYWQGCTAEELGKVFASAEGVEVPAGTIRRRIHDAKARLRKCLAEGGDPPAKADDQADAQLEGELRAIGTLLALGPSAV